MLPIVIADDARDDAFLAQRVFAHCRIQNPIHTVQSGSECLDYFAGRPPHQDRVLPCLLFLDMVMSPVSGLDVLKRLRAQPTARGSVCVMLSGVTELKTVQAGYQLGAQTFLVKPLLVADVMQMLAAIPELSVNETSEGNVISISGEHLQASRRAGHPFAQEISRGKFGN